jgi:hypothetical protein
MYPFHMTLTRQSQIEHSSVRAQHRFNARLEGFVYGLYFGPNDGVVCAAREHSTEEKIHC